MPKQQDHTDQDRAEDHSETRAESPADSASGNDPLAALTADLQRVQADFINYRRRMEAEKADTQAYVAARIVRQFLAVRDSFDAEAAHRPPDADPAWAKSIDAIRTQFDAVRTGLGVTRFDSLGAPFDPHRHEAVAMEEGEGDAEVVVAELQPGYQMGETVLRHAVVKVGPADKGGK
jgi:molecular chaperone GrpE